MYNSKHSHIQYIPTIAIYLHRHYMWLAICLNTSFEVIASCIWLLCRLAVDVNTIGMDKESFVSTCRSECDWCEELWTWILWSPSSQLSWSDVVCCKSYRNWIRIFRPSTSPPAAI